MIKVFVWAYIIINAIGIIEGAYSIDKEREPMKPGTYIISVAVAVAASSLLATAYL